MEIQFQLMPVHKHLFVEANPIPVKWAMARMGLCGGTMRLPMTPVQRPTKPVVEGACAPAACSEPRPHRHPEDFRVKQICNDLGLLGLVHAAVSLLRAGRRQDRLQKRHQRAPRWRCPPT
jgi:hypothetical protein